MIKLVQQLWADDQGQDIAEYAVMLAVILVIVVGTIRLIGTNANDVEAAAVAVGGTAVAVGVSPQAASKLPRSSTVPRE